MTTLKEKKYLGRLVSLGCILCKRLGYEDTPSEVHHIRTGTGGGRRANNYNTLPLCVQHHRGNEGIHGLGVKGFAKHYGVTELELLEEVRALLTP